MDPQACLASMISAIIDNDIEKARDNLFDLATWIGNGGYCPIVTPDMCEGILRRRWEMVMAQTRRSYHFDLVCPKCGKESDTVSDHRVPPPRVNCGDCLVNDLDVVEMKVTKVEVVLP